VARRLALDRGVRLRAQSLGDVLQVHARRIDGGIRVEHEAELVAADTDPLRHELLDALDVLGGVPADRGDVDVARPLGRAGPHRAGLALRGVLEEVDPLLDELGAPSLQLEDDRVGLPQLLRQHLPAAGLLDRAEVAELVHPGANGILGLLPHELREVGEVARRLLRGLARRGHVGGREQSLAEVGLDPDHLRERLRRAPAGRDRPLDPDLLDRALDRPRGSLARRERFLEHDLRRGPAAGLGGLHELEAGREPLDDRADAARDVDERERAVEDRLEQRRVDLLLGDDVERRVAGLGLRRLRLGDIVVDRDLGLRATRDRAGDDQERSDAGAGEVGQHEGGGRQRRQAERGQHLLHLAIAHLVRDERLFQLPAPLGRLHQLVVDGQEVAVIELRADQRHRLVDLAREGLERRLDLRARVLAAGGREPAGGGAGPRAADLVADDRVDGGRVGEDRLHADVELVVVLLDLGVVLELAALALHVRRHRGVEERLLLLVLGGAAGTRDLGVVPADGDRVRLCHSVLRLLHLLGEQLRLAQVGVLLGGRLLVFARDAEPLHLLQDEVAVGLEVAEHLGLHGGLELGAQVLEARQLDQVGVGLERRLEQLAVGERDLARVAAERAPDAAGGCAARAQPADLLELLALRRALEVDRDPEPLDLLLLAIHLLGGEVGVLDALHEHPAERGVAAAALELTERSRAHPRVLVREAVQPRRGVRGRRRARAPEAERGALRRSGRRLVHDGGSWLLDLRSGPLPAAVVLVLHPRPRARSYQRPVRGSTSGSSRSEKAHYAARSKRGSPRGAS
jgi:hypothetical protein